MSKLIFEKKEVEDSYKEHEAYHQSFHSDCSECYRENRLIKAHRLITRKHNKDVLERFNPLRENNPHI